jgi:hypothetical protein
LLDEDDPFYDAFFESELFDLEAEDDFFGFSASSFSSAIDRAPNMSSNYSGSGSPIS